MKILHQIYIFLQISFLEAILNLNYISFLS